MKFSQKQVNFEATSQTGAARPPFHCPVRSVILDISYPVLVEVPFLEISIQPKCRQAAQTQQEPFGGGKQKEQSGK